MWGDKDRKLVFVVQAGFHWHSFLNSVRGLPPEKKGGGPLSRRARVSNGTSASERGPLLPPHYIVYLSGKTHLPIRVSSCPSRLVVDSEKERERERRESLHLPLYSQKDCYVVKKPGLDQIFFFYI